MREREREGGDRTQSWTEVRRRNRRRNEGKGTEVTFFVQNIPDGVTRQVLWKAFQPCGRISDAYIAKRQDANKNFFGFVRFVGVTNLDEMLLVLNSVTVSHAKLTVSLAKYDKSHNKILYPTGLVFGRAWKPKVNADIPVKHGNNLSNGFSGFQAGYSFKDAVEKNGQPEASNSKIITVDSCGASYPIHCVNRSIVATAKNLNAITVTKYILAKEGFEGVGVSYLGGLKVLISFHDQSSAKEFLSNKSEIWSEYFDTESLWHGEPIPFERLTRIKIFGGPLQIRDSSLYDQIGSLFGKVADHSDFSWEASDNSGGQCCISTDSKQMIHEVVNIVWKNQSYPVWVTETVFDWIPEFSIEDPVVNNRYNKNTVDDMAQDDLEDGEIRQEFQPENGRLSPNNNNDGGSFNNNNNDAGFFNDGGFHTNNDAGFFNDGDSHTQTPTLHARLSPNCEVQSNQIHLGLGSKQMPGPNSQSKFRKRGRDLRSPPSIGSTQGPLTRPAIDLKNPIPSFIDLNSPAGKEHAASDIGAVEGGHQPDDVVIQEAVEASVIGDVTGSRSNSPMDQMTPALNDEVLATAQVGNLVGFQLNGFDKEIGNIIIGEGGDNGSS